MGTLAALFFDMQRYDDIFSVYILGVGNDHKRASDGHRVDGEGMKFQPLRQIKKLLKWDIVVVDDFLCISYCQHQRIVAG